MILGRLLAGCGLLALTGSLPQVWATPTEPALVVFAAADLEPAFTEIGPLFERATGDRVVFSFGASGSLATQIELGAPADLFFSADEGYVRRLVTGGALDGATARTYAEGRLVLVTLRERATPIGAITDLVRGDVARVALANPEHAPYGRAARQALISAKIWDSLQPKLVLGENVRQAAQYLSAGAVDAALVSGSLSLDSTLVAIPIATELYPPILQAAAVVRQSPRREAAVAFLDFVTGTSGWAVMSRHGFAMPHDR